MECSKKATHTSESSMVLLIHRRFVSQRITRCAIRSMHSSRFLLNSNAPKFDEADLLSPKITSQPYKAKQSKNEFKWPSKSEEQMKRDYEARIEKFMRLSAVLQGFLFLAAVGFTGTIYLKWPQVKSWWITKDFTADDDTLEKLVKIKEKNSLAQIPTIPETELDPEVPGLYYWGGIDSNSKNNKPGVVFPRRVTSFDNMYLREVCLAVVDGKEVNLAVDEKGNLLKWNRKTCKVLLPDQNLVSVKESNGYAYALNKRGEILVIPLNDNKDMAKYVSLKRSWILPWKKHTLYHWKLNTGKCFHSRGEKKVIQFDTGKTHLVMISNVGKVYTCSTGSQPSPDAKSYGQFGVPGMSRFDEFPVCNELHEIELLNNGLSNLNTVYRRNIQQVACGDYHTLARDSTGKLFVFGSNTYGQLGFPISYDTEQLAFPKRLTRFQSYFKRDCITKCKDIYCSGETSYVVMESSPLDVQHSDNLPFSNNVTYFSFGNGLFGELGNGRYMNSQPDPTPIRIINNDSGSCLVDQWSCGHNHVICKLHSGEVLAWGVNDNGQLGSGKRLKQCKPQYLPDLLQPGTKKSSTEIFSSRLHLNAQQALATGPFSSCIYWKK